MWFKKKQIEIEKPETTFVKQLTVVMVDEQVATVVVHSTDASELEDTFDDFLAWYGTTYSSVEHDSPYVYRHNGFSFGVDRRDIRYFIIELSEQ